MLQSESPSIMHAKLHTVAASIRDHMPGLLYFRLFTPLTHTYYSSGTSRLWRIAHSTSFQPKG